MYGRALNIYARGKLPSCHRGAVWVEIMVCLRSAPTKAK